MPSNAHEAKARARLAAALKKERARLGWTQEEAAEHAGINVRHFQKVEEGSVNVTLRTLIRLSLGLKVDIQRLFDR